MIDPYQVLGVSRSASDDEIKKAYRSSVSYTHLIDGFVKHRKLQA